MLRLTPILLSASLVAGCYTVPPDEDYAQSHSTDVVALTMMSQMAIIAGGPGLVFLPVLIAADIHAANEAMVRSKSRATIEQTYQFAYDRSLNSVGATGNTGVLFRDMKSATRYFRTVLQGHGVARTEDFVLTAVRTADTQGYTLYALVHRPFQTIRVRTARGDIRTLTPRDEAFYRPYRVDASGRELDVVVDWAGVPRTSISTQKGQAILLTLAANSVLMNRRSDDFWYARQQWLSGNYRRVVDERKREIDRRLAAG